MKIRSDFVSNSSSSSFIILDAAKAAKVLNDAAGNSSVPYKIEDSIRISVDCLVRDASTLAPEFGQTYTYVRYNPYDVDRKFPVNMDDLHTFYDIELYQFLNLDVKYFSKIVSVRFSTASDGDDVERTFLYLLYSLLKRNEVPVDEKDSEIEFSQLNTFIKRLIGFSDEN